MLKICGREYEYLLLQVALEETDLKDPKLLNNSPKVGYLTQYFEDLFNSPQLFYIIPKVPKLA